MRSGVGVAAHPLPAILERNRFEVEGGRAGLYVVVVDVGQRLQIAAIRPTHENPVHPINASITGKGREGRVTMVACAP